MTALMLFLLLFPTSPHVTPPAPTVTAAPVVRVVHKFTAPPAVRWTPGMHKTFRPAPPRPPRPHGWRWQ